MTEPHDAIASECRYLTDQGIGFKDTADTIVALRVAVNQTMMSYSTSGQEPGLHMVRHVGGLAQQYFNLNVFAQIVKPREPMKSFGEWLVHLDQSVQRAEESVLRGATGDAKSHFMNLLGVVLGCLKQYGATLRQGYEDGETQTQTQRPEDQEDVNQKAEPGRTGSAGD